MAPIRQPVEYVLEPNRQGVARDRFRLEHFETELNEPLSLDPGLRDAPSGGFDDDPASASRLGLLRSDRLLRQEKRRGRTCHIEC